MEYKHPARVEDIFEQGSTDEDGHTTGFYEVVRLKGKAMPRGRGRGTPPSTISTKRTHIKEGREKGTAAERFVPRQSPL